MKLVKEFPQDQGNEPARQYTVGDENMVTLTHYAHGEEVTPGIELIKIFGSTKISDVKFYQDGKEVQAPRFH